VKPEEEERHSISRGLNLTEGIRWIFQFVQPRAVESQRTFDLCRCAEELNCQGGVSEGVPPSGPSQPR